jgi:hypothetical protein
MDTETVICHIVDLRSVGVLADKPDQRVGTKLRKLFPRPCKVIAESRFRHQDGSSEFRNADE